VKAGRRFALTYPTWLWWPATHGGQPLYRLTVELLDASGAVSDAMERTVGFRRVRWLDNPEAPAGAKPYLCEVNGVPGCSSVAALERHRGDQLLWPPRATNRYWLVPTAVWIPWDDVVGAFGEIADEPASLPTVVKAHRYLLSQQEEHPLAPLLALPAAVLEARRESPGRVFVRNAGATAALDVRLSCEVPNWALLTSGGSTVLLPGESRALEFEAVPLEAGLAELPQLMVECLNQPTGIEV
jgi:hypothetical protein